MELQYEIIKNKSKEEIETENMYLIEENTDLRHKIQIGKQAEGILQKNEIRVTELMDAYLGMEGKTVIPIADYEILKKELERADSLYEVREDLKELKDTISRSGYVMDQTEIFRILDNMDKSIGEDMNENK